jgi:hypothetical protein
VTIITGREMNWKVPIFVLQANSVKRGLKRCRPVDRNIWVKGRGMLGEPVASSTVQRDL